MAEKLRILIVEDEPSIRELTQARLEQAGYEVQSAADGYRGLSLYRTFQPDLVLLDLMLPKLDGYTICRMMKASGHEPVPIILYSARSAPEDARLGIELGADAFVSKAGDFATLLSKIEELLKPKLDALRAATGTAAGPQPAAPQSAPAAAAPTTAAVSPPAEPAPQAEPAAPQETKPAAEATTTPAPPAEPAPVASEPTATTTSPLPETKPQPAATAAVPEPQPAGPAAATVSAAPTAAAATVSPAPTAKPAEPEEPKPAAAPPQAEKPRPVTPAELSARVRPPAPEATAESAAAKPETKPGFFARLFGWGKKEKKKEN